MSNYVSNLCISEGLFNAKNESKKPDEKKSIAFYCRNSRQLIMSGKGKLSGKKSKF